MTAPGDHPRVLIARSEDRAAGLVSLLDHRGIPARAAPVVERAQIEDAAGRAELTRARTALASGAYAWVTLTSVNAADALLDPESCRDSSRKRASDGHGPWRPDRGGPTRWACVGPATRRAVEGYGFRVDLVPDGPMTAAGLVAVFPSPVAGTPPDAGPGSAARVLVPLGDLAAPTLPDGLRAKGWEPDVVVAYRTVARELPADVVERATGAGYELVVVASGSAARELAAQLGAQRVVAIGDPSARAARAAGHDVVAVAARPDDAALADAVVGALGTPDTSDGPAPGTS